MRLVLQELSRRTFALGAMISLLPIGSRRACAASSEQAGDRRRSLLGNVRRWGCQYQNVDLVALGNSVLDMVVIDPSLDDDARRFITPRECGLLKRKPDGSRRLVIAYLCIGEVDTKRWYWPLRYRLKPPDWLGNPNPSWPGAHHVEFWNEEWWALVAGKTESVLSRILDIGFDGVLLDRMDGFMDWQSFHPNAGPEMIDLVHEIAATARSTSPEFLVLGQNAEPLVVHPRLAATLDGHNKESLLTGLAAPGQRNSVADVDWSLDHLRKLAGRGVVRFATEYVSDPLLACEVRRELVDMGFVPFLGSRALDRLPEGEHVSGTGPCK